jgi:hypothetical protein
MEWKLEKMKNDLIKYIFKNWFRGFFFFYVFSVFVYILILVLIDLTFDLNYIEIMYTMIVPSALFASLFYYVGKNFP